MTSPSANIQSAKFTDNPFWLLASDFSIFAAMFETVKTEITTATGKLTHLRRFL